MHNFALTLYVELQTGVRIQMAALTRYNGLGIPT
jgi:hypothetical protein